MTDYECNSLSATNASKNLIDQSEERILLFTNQRMAVLKPDKAASLLAERLNVIGSF